MKIDMYQIDTTWWGWIKFLLYFVLASAGVGLNYIGVKSDLVYTLTTLMVMDWITGVIKAWKLGNAITSKKSSKGLLEKVVLMVIPISIAITLKAVGLPIGVTIQAIFSILCLTELYSLIGNCYCIYTGVDEKEFDAATAVIKWLRKIILTALKNVMKNNK